MKGGRGGKERQRQRKCVVDDEEEGKRGAMLTTASGRWPAVEKGGTKQSEKGRLPRWRHFFGRVPRGGREGEAGDTFYPMTEAVTRKKKGKKRKGGRWRNLTGLSAANQGGKKGGREGDREHAGCDTIKDHFLKKKGKAKGERREEKPILIIPTCGSRFRSDAMQEKKGEARHARGPTDPERADPRGWTGTKKPAPSRPSTCAGPPHAGEGDGHARKPESRLLQLKGHPAADKDRGRGGNALGERRLELIIRLQWEPWPEGKGTRTRLFWCGGGKKKRDGCFLARRKRRADPVVALCSEGRGGGPSTTRNWPAPGKGRVRGLWGRTKNKKKK